MNARISKYLEKRDNSRDYDFVRLLRSVRDFNPDVSKAMDNIVTLANPGYTLKVYKNTGSIDEPKPDKIGQRIVDEFAARCFGEYSGAYDELPTGSAVNNYSGLNSLINMCHLVSFTQGAFAAEVQLTPDLNDIIDVFPVDPQIIDFQRDENHVWYPFVTNDPERRRLNPHLFRYIPKDPDVDQPGGRSPLMAAVDIVMFQQQVMRDLQAVAHQSNQPRLDVKVVEQTVNNVLNDSRPDLLGIGREAERQAFLDGYLSDLKDLIDNLEADDAFVHWDAVEVDIINSGKMAIEIKDLISAIDKSIVSATKQLPILLGRNEGATTTHATVQWQVYILQINSFQKISHSLVTWLLNLLLRVNGRNSYVSFEYKRHKTTDDFLDAQALNMNVFSHISMVQQGWESNDQAAMAVTGHVAVGEPMQTNVKQQSLPGSPPPVVGDMSGKGANA